MLTDEDIERAWLGDQTVAPRGGRITGFSRLASFARAIESAVSAEYADVPPEKWKALYRSCALRQRGFEGLSGELYEAMKAIDSGTYNPKIGGEE